MLCRRVLLLSQLDESLFAKVGTLGQLCAKKWRRQSMMNHTAENGGRGGRDLGGDSFNVNSSYLLPKNVFHPWCISASLEALRAPSWCHKVPKSGLSINSTSLSQGSSDDKSQH